MKNRVGLFLLVLLGFAAAAAPASAEGEAVQVKLTVKDASGEKVAVTGASFSVESDGEVVGSGLSDDEGVFLLEVPGPGEYTVAIDPDTLPDGVSLTNPDRIANTVNVDPGGTGNTIFGLETEASAAAKKENTGGVTLRRVSQLTVDGIKLGLFLAMAAIGLSLIFGTTGLVNFAHSEMIAFGMFAAYFFNFYGLAGVFGFMANWPAPFGAGVNLILAIPIAVVCGGLFGYFLDYLIFSRLRRMGVSLIAQLVVSIGLSIFLRYFFLLVFGGNKRFYAQYTAQRARTYFGLVDLTDKDLVTMVVTLVVLVCVGLVLSKTRTGKAMRAVSDNRDLAESSGIDVENVIRMVWAAGGALAALGGIFLGLSETVNWLLGFKMLLLIFAGVTLGGLGTTYGALVGCLLIGAGISLSTLVLPVELKNVGALAVLIIVLLFRPQGLLGRAERVG